MNEEWQPTKKLRWLTRESDKVLQQWWAPDVPSYMRDLNVGEWRDVPVAPESAP